MQSSRPLHLYRSKNGRPSISGAVNLVLSLYQTLSYVWIILLILQKPFEVAKKSLVWNLLKIKSLVNLWHFKLTFWTSFRSIISLKISTTFWNEFKSKLVFYKQMAFKLSGLKSRNIFYCIHTVYYSICTAQYSYLSSFIFS